ncbi:hypothetical protein CEXT_538161 [Caerostris extrusa]|uniref:Uncharacterized protein n=1 Tax=Caerostris extrusa TaxID=172846 RepID=A0AAV4RFW6_CAEEX|nr:hypothetical protein CEXT_538161 [Caerostris extrusa]
MYNPTVAVLVPSPSTVPLLPFVNKHPIRCSIGKSGSNGHTFNIRVWGLRASYNEIVSVQTALLYCRSTSDAVWFEKKP